MVSHIMKDAGRARATGLNPATCAMDIMVGIRMMVRTVLLVNTKWEKLAIKIITA